jgi:LPS O-antigen subunit length determinant protein (WzzB/FepE family)
MIAITEFNKLLLDRIHDQTPVQEKPLDRWYEQCYPIVIDWLSREEDLRTKAAIAIIATGAWVSKIVTGNISTEMIAEFENYYNLVPPSLNDISVSNQPGQKITIKSSANSDFNFTNYYSQCNKLVNSSSDDRKDKNAATVSKFMHFLSPKTFPIFDVNIAKRVKLTNAKGSTNLSMAQYIQYISAIYTLKEQYENTWSSIEELSEQKQCSPIRVVDNLLFRE